MVPDTTAVIAALNRAAHLVVDEPPHVIRDDLALALANDPAILRAIGFDISKQPRGDGWPFSPRALPSGWRGTFVARARFLDDHIDDQMRLGSNQVVVLGAGLDTTALGPHNGHGLAVFEVDQPETQQWKRDRIRQLNLDPSASLVFVSVDFESGQPWLTELRTAGFDDGRPAVFASTGVSQYLTKDALAGTMRDISSTAPGTSLYCTFVLPIHLVADDEREVRRSTEEIAATVGAPWLGVYEPEEIVALARDSGFKHVRHVSSDEWNERYFATRPDQLRAATSEHAIVATR